MNQAILILILFISFGIVSCNAIGERDYMNELLRTELRALHAECMAIEELETAMLQPPYIYN